MPSTLLDAAEVAAWLNVKESWVRKQASRGLLPHIKLGKYLRFRSEDIEGWLRERSS